jgi:hypothetical protein
MVRQNLASGRNRTGEIEFHSRKVATPDKPRNRKLHSADGLGRLRPGTGVDKSSSHHLSRFEIDGENPCSQQLSDVDIISPMVALHRAQFGLDSGQ